MTDATSPPGRPAAPSSAIPGLEPGPWRRSPIRRAILIAAVVALIVFWIWALFFASKTAINKIEDRGWAARAEAICAGYDARFAEFTADATADLDGRADLVDGSTDLLGEMLDELVAVRPNDEKGQAIVPDWESEYRILLQDRYRYADRLRAGENVPFTETAINGVPVTERLEKFTLDNEMDSCAPPRGSIV